MGISPRITKCQRRDTRRFVHQVVKFHDDHIVGDDGEVGSICTRLVFCSNVVLNDIRRRWMLMSATTDALLAHRTLDQFAWHRAKEAEENVYELVEFPLLCAELGLPPREIHNVIHLAQESLKRRAADMTGATLRLERFDDWVQGYVVHEQPGLESLDKKLQELAEKTQDEADAAEEEAIDSGEVDVIDDIDVELAPIDPPLLHQEWPEDPVGRDHDKCLFTIFRKDAEPLQLLVRCDEAAAKRIYKSYSEPFTRNGTLRKGRIKRQEGESVSYIYAPAPVLREFEAQGKRFTLVELWRICVELSLPDRFTEGLIRQQERRWDNVDYNLERKKQKELENELKRKAKREKREEEKRKALEAKKKLRLGGV